MDEEFEKELEDLKRNGLKENPPRLEYEQQVRELSHLKKELPKSGYCAEETARLLHSRQRALGERYKDAAPPLFRIYILYATEKKYGDPLGPSYEALRRHARPIQNLDSRLTVEGFIQWFYEVYQM